jgi:hypothetical protein
LTCVDGETGATQILKCGVGFLYLGDQMVNASFSGGLAQCVDQPQSAGLREGFKRPEEG